MLPGMAGSTINPRLSPSVSRGSAADLRCATIAQHHILLEGPDISIEAVLLLLAPYLREPLTWNQPGTSLKLPANDYGALVLQNVAGLNRVEQARLLAWLDDLTHQTQVVSTTTSPLVPLVYCNLFDATLYYRLSVLRFPLDQT
jgi:sigma-54-interacting transcriptional regulator